MLSISLLLALSVVPLFIDTSLTDSEADMNSYLPTSLEVIKYLPSPLAPVTF